MTENRGGLSGTTRSAGADGNAGLARAYLLTYRGPSDGSPADGGVTAPIDVAMATRVSPELLAAHYRLGHRRSTGRPSSRSTPPTIPVASARRCRSSPITARC